MAVLGVWRLQKLLVNYCDISGGSRGMREFVQTFLPRFAAANPQIEVQTELNRGHDPYLKGFYVTKNDRVIGVRNLDPRDILKHARRLRNSTGRKVVKLKTRHVTSRPSIQGTWTPFMKI